MALDAGIILSGKGLQLDNQIDNAQKAQNLQQMAFQNQQMQQEQQDKNTMSSLLKKNVVTDSQGRSSLNQGAALSDMYKFNPQKAMAFQEQMKNMDLDKLKRDTEISKQFAWSATPENYSSYKQKMIEMGVMNAEKLPDMYDPNFVKRWQIGTLEGEKQVAMMYQDKDLQSKMLDRKETRDERKFQTGVKMDEKMQGLKTPFGLANTEDDAKKLKEAFESKQNFDNKLDQMIELRKKHSGGAIMNRDDVARGKQLSKDLLLEYKNMAKLGVLSKSDEDIINAIIPEDPLQYNSPLASIQGQDPTLARLQSFKNDSEKDFNTKVATRTRSGVEGAAKQKMSTQDAEAMFWAQKNPNDPRSAAIMKKLEGMSL
ncbi:hypothetical protein UFOVP610_10 [uncultured Caudovirales phage]|uniref:Uncharacterized protein n=1 Tax=uncultured Caudovirales phage TaxID=2100421 RepID=A0A6J5N261_9CAUD|nr:hypothetical protein UFOVP610_10 [uncultured Caudovirales phage]